MLKKTVQYAALAAACVLTLWACKRDDVPSVAGQQTKSPIELTVGIAGNGADLATKTVVSSNNPYGTSAGAFAATTNLYMVMKADESTPSEPALGAKYTRTMGVTADKVGEEAFNAVNFNDGYIRYWEDAHSRNSALNIYAACVPGKQNVISIASSTTYNSNSWSIASVTPTIAWPLSGTVATQDTDFIANQDLCFSNNVSNLSSDNRVKFSNGTPNKFDSKRLYFNHALTKITFKISRGVGFGSEEGVFTFSESGKNIELVGFNSTGTLDISTGEFGSIGTTAINCFADTKQAGDTEDYVLTALVLPGTDLYGADKDALDKINFTIDHNQYHIAKAQLKTALDDKKLSDNTTPALDANKLRPGVHYIFTLTVGKTQVNQLTAAVVDWETVAAVVSPSNARVNVSLLEAGTSRTDNPATFDLYMSTVTSDALADNSYNNYSWTSGYVGNKATLTWSTDHYSTDWLWPDNKTFYHFRAVAPINHPVATNSTPDPDIDYLTLTGASSYTDVQWGAPFLYTNGKLTYSTATGFDNTNGENHQIYKAIGATNEVIKLVMFHMMSEVKIVLHTTNGADAVTLAGSTLSFTNIASTGTVNMGDGLVTPGSTSTLSGGTVNATTFDWSYGFVPQSLADVTLTITTPDNNQYKINMVNVVASSIESNLIANPYTGSKIDRWYPNYKYTYTFTLKKTGVEKITCTLANWETVTAGDDNVQIQ